MDNLYLRAASSVIGGRLANLPPFSVPLKEEKWVLLSVAAPTFPGWVNCPPEINNNYYGTSIYATRDIVMGHEEEVNLHSFSLVQSVNYQINYNSIQAIYMKLYFTVIINGQTFSIFNKGIEQIYAVSYNYVDFENVDSKITSVNLLPAGTPAVNNKIIIPPYCSNTCFTADRGQQVQAFWGCYDWSYDGGDFNYKEGYFKREGNTLVFKMPSVDTIIYNNRGEPIVKAYRIECPIYRAIVNGW